MKSVWKAFKNEECVESFCYCGESVCKTFVIVSVCKAFVIVVNEDCVQSLCYCGE